MALTAEEIIQLMQKAKELGVTNLNVEGTSMSFEQASKEPEPSTPPEPASYSDKELQAPLQFYDELLSDNELLLYAAVPHFAELYAKKQALKKQREQEDKQRQID